MRLIQVNQTLRVRYQHLLVLAKVSELSEDDQDKLDGNVSTTGITGIGATTVEAIVYKINNTVMNTWLEAEMINNFTNQEFTNAANINFADASPLKGGRG